MTSAGNHDAPADTAPAPSLAAPAPGPAPVPPEPAPSAPPSPLLPTAPTAPTAPPSSWVARVGVAVAALALVGVAMLWQKLSHIQEQLARQSTDSIKVSTEARTVAKEAESIARDTSARLSVAETKVSEVALQRTQLEDLIQSLSRSRDENLVVDIESALRLAQQQAQLSGSVEPLLAALRSAEQRVTRAAQPRLAPLQRALTRDIAKVKAATVTDTASLLSRFDEMVRLVDDLPLANAVAPVSPNGGWAVAAPRQVASAKPASTQAQWQAWLEQTWGVVWHELRNLLRVSRITNPEAVLLTPDQGFFVRENLKLKLLNARLGLLSRQLDSARSDVGHAQVMVNKYFDSGARRTETLSGLLVQTQTQMKTLELPRVDDTLAALATAASGR